jgi:hypothetical protein
MVLQDYRSLIIIVVFAITSGNLFSQCLCSEIKFQLILSDLKFKKNSSNYSTKIITAPDFLKMEKWKKIKKMEINGDTLNFQFRTQGGIDTLTFTIINNKTNDEMIITVINMTYDNPYFIDLTTFSSGHYFFDWQKINKCQKEKPTIEFINCDGMKFYQLQLKTEKEISLLGNFVHNKIKPYDLKQFEKY